MLVNGLRGSGIQLGQTLAIPTGDIEVLVRKSDFRLYVLIDDVVVLDYPVGLGRDGSTPVGEFTISGKTRDPSWRAPDGRLIPFGDPEHIIGNRWMGFDDAKGRTGYGIHGTVDEASIGKQESDGCIRMGKADVEALFDLVPEGCRVVVRP
ncbi:MAG: L,D-transpeptidase [Planctomycetota bacterium]